MIKDKVLTQRRRSGIYSETPDTLSKIDSKISEKEHEIVWEVWDKNSPINGVPAATVLKRPDIPRDGEIYIVKRGGKVIYFQPHKPGISGIHPISKEEISTVAGEHYEEIVASEVIATLDEAEGATELDEVKARKLAELAEIRWNTENAPFYYAPKDARFDVSEKSQIKYLQAAQKSKPQVWKTKDGLVEMSQGDFVSLIAAYEAFIEEIFAREFSLVEQVQAAQTVEAVEAVEW